jgi:5'-3' exoribonuclease 1
MHNIVYRYIEGIQWVLHYYYDGVVSWGWFYDYHYAPKISDLKGIEAFEFDYTLGGPFRPFEQLMGVLPDLSNAIIPDAFRDLMSDPASPIIDFYPRNFIQDLNGKKQDWEAIVKIPFIDEKRLLSTMKSAFVLCPVSVGPQRARIAREGRLSPEEQKRNGFGHSWRFILDPDGEQHHYPSSMPGFFPDIVKCAARMEAFHLPTIDGLHLVKGLCEGVLLGKDAIAGFPSLHTLPHTGQLGYHSVKVFMSESRHESMVIHLENPYEGTSSNDIARSLIGQPVYVNWPFLQEGKVEAVSDELFRYEADNIQIPHRPDVVATRRRGAERIEHEYSKRWGVVTGDVDVVVHVKLLKGLKRTEDGALVKDYEDKEVDHAVQASVTHVNSQDERYIVRHLCPLGTAKADQCTGTRGEADRGRISRGQQYLLPRRAIVRFARAHPRS